MPELYDKIWEIIRTEVNDEVVCDMLTDQIIEQVEKCATKDYISTFEQHLKKIEEFEEWMVSTDPDLTENTNVLLYQTSHLSIRYKNFIETLKEMETK